MKEKLKYGVDAPLVPILYIGVGLIVLIVGILALAGVITHYNGAGWTLAYGIFMIAGGLTFIHTSLRGKFVIWKNLLSGFKIKRNSKVVDLGCGHGAVMLEVAKHLDQNGKITGVDIWRSQDQSNNSVHATNKNLTDANLSVPTELVTADMRDLPFKASQFDYAVTGFAVHNIKPRADREKALAEAYRVLKKDGKLLLVDTGSKHKEYIQKLQELGMRDITMNQAGFNGWWSGPWMSSYIITATK